jgi:hypothetical protein
MFLVIIDRSHVATPNGAFKISFACWIFRFSRLGLGSLLRDLSWSIRLSAASVVAPYYTVGSHYGAHANVGFAEIFWRWTLS